MAALRLFTDEDVYAAVAIALRRAGLDALSTPEAGRSGESDEAQLEWTSTEGRSLLSFNVGHFAAVHTQWVRSGRHHGGIILSSQRGVGEVIRRVLNLAANLDAD